MINRLAELVAPAGLLTAADAGTTALIEAAARACDISSPSGTAPAWNGAVIFWHTPQAQPGTRFFALGLTQHADVDAVVAAATDAGVDAAAHRERLAELQAAPATTDRHTLFANIVEELADTAEERASFDAATEAVDQAYEMIDLLHNLGSVVSDPTRQQELVTTAAEEIRDTLGFGWVLVAVEPSRSAGIGLDSPIMFSAHDDIHTDRVLGRLRELRIAAQWPEVGEVRRSIDEDQRLLGNFTVIEPIRVDGTPVGVIIAGAKRSGAPEVSSFDQRMLQSVASYVGPMMRVAELFEAQQRLFFGTVNALTSTVDAKDPYTRGHSERVAHLGGLLAEALGWDAAAVERVRLAGMLHDIGKIGVPERVLRKAGPLTDDEFAEIKKHPGIGHKILAGVPGLDDVLPGVLSHHERWDGRGYPESLQREAIPMIARILGLADTFDAMSSNRAYRPGMDRAKVLAEIERCGGTQFDPTLALVFITLDFTEYDRLVASAAAQEAYRDAA